MIAKYAGHILVCIHPLLLLLCSCAQPARYIIISEDVKNISWENADQRYICLTKKDAQNNNAILALYTKADIQNYEQKRNDARDPAEDVLSYVIRADYKQAAELLSQYGDTIPDYLRLLLKADLAYEGAEGTIQANQLVKMYQEAFEVQASDISRNIIQRRIRQLRYRR